LRCNNVGIQVFKKLASFWFGRRPRKKGPIGPGFA
jgi:hypothetical protein